MGSFPTFSEALAGARVQTEAELLHIDRLSIRCQACAAFSVTFKAEDAERTLRLWLKKPCPHCGAERLVLLAEREDYRPKWFRNYFRREWDENRQRFVTPMDPIW